MEWIELLWEVLSNPRSIAGPDDVGNLAFLGIIAAVITAAFMATVVRRIVKRRYVIAILAGSLFLPLLMNIAAWGYALSNLPDRHGYFMLLFGALLFSICALPVTLTTSVLYVALRRRRLAH